MNSSKNDVAVLLIFFTRTIHTTHTFAQIQKARPSKLFLYQDGPRPGREDDVKNVKECRNAIESMIDWDCEVHRMYQEKNYGCDPSEYIAQKWMFSIVDRGIIIEDDDVMSESFFPFCKELLDKYENDERIGMICGMNNLGTYDAGGADYFFCQGGAIWGWATWRRVVDEWDTTYQYLEDKYACRCLEQRLGSELYNGLVSTCKRHKASGREHYETINGMNIYVSNRLNIVPSKNMTCNIGIGIETTHSVSNITLLPRRTRNILFMDTYEIEFPLKHPKYIMEDMKYMKDVREAMAGSHLSRLFRINSIESRLYRMIPFLGRIGSEELLNKVDHFTK